MKAFHLHGAELRQAAQVVAAQIDEHVVLGELLGVGQKVGFHGGVLGGRGAARAGARQREGMQDPVFQLDEGFGARPGNLHVGAGEVEQVRARVNRAQGAVGVEQRALVPGLQAVGEHHLEDVAFADVGLGRAHHVAVGRLVEEFAGRRGEMAGLVGGHLAVGKQAFHLLEVAQGLAVAGFAFAQVGIDDQQDLLLAVVENDDLVEEHEVDVLETFGIFGVQAQGGLGILQVVVAEVAHQPAGERRQAVDARQAVGVEQLAEIVARAGGVDLQGAGFQMAVHAGDAKCGLVAQEGVAAPFAALPRHAFQKEAVVRHVAQHAQHVDRRVGVAHDLARQGHARAACVRGDLHGLVVGEVHHGPRPFRPKRVFEGSSGHKKRPRRNLLQFPQGRIFDPRCHLDSRLAPCA